ncbi:MAG: LptF/LptG family permease, partial [Porphyromonadaceae bacterium]|nr:LptF/LptG family permease [Porphyromonadaceae bacterium]
YRKFTMPFACFSFCFLGAPLGAIIRKGGLGTPVVISIFLYICYFIIDNIGYKSALNGRVSVEEGMWISSVILLALGIFLTYKAVNDSAVFNKDAYLNFLRKIVGKSETRNVIHKEVIMDEATPEELDKLIDRLDQACGELRSRLGEKAQSFFAYWTRGYDRKAIRLLHNEVEDFVERAQNSRSLLLVTKLMDYPILRNLLLYNPCGRKTVGWVILWIFPITLPVYLIGRWEQKQLRLELATINRTDQEIKKITRQLLTEKAGKNNE